MSIDETPPKRKLPIVPLVGLLLVVAIGGLLVIRGVDVRGLMERGVDVIRGFGAVAFFGAMTILPAFGVPMLFFTMTAGEAFAPELGMAGVIVTSLAVIAVNLALGYWVARYALRPLLARLITRYGYTVPRITKENALTVTLLVRLTPGPPYALQACLLGLAEVPFRIYLVVSWLTMVPITIGAVVLGKGLLAGKFGLAATGLGLLVVAAIVVQLIRRKYARRKLPADGS